MIRRRTITSYVWNSVSGNKMVILSNCIRNFFRKFELLGNSVQGENPAPDNPQEIKSAGRKSRNLLIENMSVFTVQDNIAYIPLPEGHETKLYTMLIRKKPNKNDDIGFSCGFYDKSNANEVYSAPCLKDGKLINENGIVNSKVGVNHFICFKPANEKFFDIYNVMYVEGKETTLDYEPYGYLLDVKVTGENLLSNKSADWQIGKGLSWSTYPNDPISIYRVINGAVNVINLKPSTTYSIVNNSEKIVISRMIERNLSENGIKDHDVRSSKYTFVTNQNAMNAILQLKKVDGTELLSSDIESIKIMLVEGEADENVPYEPYTEQSMQIALNEPLRGIGEYKDTITKDGVVRKIKRTVFDGSEDEKWGIGIERENVIDFVSTQFSDATKINEHQRSMMDKLKWSSGVWGRDEIGQDMFARILRINMPKTLTPDLQTFKTWLSQNPLTVDYVLETPITEPLPESVQQQLQALHSENGTTHVFVDSGEVEAGINIEYKYKS